jgi:hypothetical protein
VAVASTELRPGVNVTPQLKLAPLNVAGTPLQETPAKPEDVSPTVPLTETGEVKMLDPVAGEVTLRLGGVLSSFTVTAAVALFPALSTAVPCTLWPAVSVVTVTGPLQDPIPLIPSEQTKLIVGLELFHPAAFGAGVTVPTMLGGVLSNLTVADTVAVLPA